MTDNEGVEASSVKDKGSDVGNLDQSDHAFRARLQSYKFVSTIDRPEKDDVTDMDTQPGSPEAVTSAKPTPTKKRRRVGEGSCGRNTRAKYAHLPELSDVLAPGLLILFIGLNPGITTAQLGQPYAHPSNLFWKLLHSSGLTDRRCQPEEHVDLPDLYRLGFTNIVSRPTRNGSELSKAEMVDGTPALEAKVRQWKPEVCCLVGKGIWEAVWKYRHRRALSKAEFKYGWQDESSNMGISRDWRGARVFVAASTSGASASLRPAEKEAIWAPLGEWTTRRREQDRV